MIPDDPHMDRPEAPDSLSGAFDEYLEAIDDLVAGVSDKDIQCHLDALMDTHCGQPTGFIPEQRGPITTIEDDPPSGMPAFEEVSLQWLPASTIIQLACSEAEEIRRRAHEDAEEILRHARHRMHDAVGVQQSALRSREMAAEMRRKAEEDMEQAGKVRLKAKQFEHQALKQAARIIGHAKEAADEELTRASEAARQADCDRKTARRTRSEAEAYAQQLIQNGADRVKNAVEEAEQILRRARMTAAGLTSMAVDPETSRTPEPVQPPPASQDGRCHWLTDRFMNWFSQRRSRLWWGVLNCQDGRAAPLPRVIAGAGEPPVEQAVVEPAADDRTPAPFALLGRMLRSQQFDLFPDPADDGKDSMSVRMVRWDTSAEDGKPPSVSEVKHRTWDLDNPGPPVDKEALRYSELVAAFAEGSEDPCPPTLLITATANAKRAKFLAVSAEFPELVNCDAGKAAA